MIKNGLLLFAPHEFVANLWILFSFYLYFLTSCVLFSTHSNLVLYLYYLLKWFYQGD